MFSFLFKKNERGDIEEILSMPEKITNSHYSLREMIKIINKMEQSDKQEAILDFEATQVFEGNLSALLGCVVRLANKKGMRCSFINVAPHVDVVLKMNGFWESEMKNNGKSVDGKQVLRGTPVKYEVFSTDEKNRLAFQNYLDSCFFPILQISELIMTKDFKSLLSSNLDELYQNARTHGRSELVHVCGQWHPSTSIMKFTMVDMGRTIPFLVKRKEGNKTDSECLQWATIEGNTTKNRDEAGGLGLYEIKKFTERNKGKLHIISGCGYFGMSDSFEELKLVDFDCSFPGTMINLEINLNDKNVHVTLNDIIRIINSPGKKLASDVIRDLF